MAIITSTTTYGSFANGSDTLFRIKALLKTAGWVVNASGTGSSGAGSGVYNGSGDAITTSALMSNTNAWFQISSPDGIFFWLMFNPGSATNFDIFGAGYPPISSGTASTLPNTPSAVHLRFSGTAGCVPGGNYRLWVAADNAPPYGCWWTTIATGGGSVFGGGAYVPLSLFNVGDARPYVMLSLPSNQSWTTNEIAQNAGDPDVPFAIGTKLAGYPPLTSQTPVQYCSFLPVSAPNTLTNPWAGSGTIQLARAATPITNSAGTGVPADVVTGKDVLFPSMFGRSLAMSNAGWKGATNFLRWRGTARANGDTASLNSTRDLIYIGDTAMPWDGSVPLV